MGICRVALDRRVVCSVLKFVVLTSLFLCSPLVFSDDQVVEKIIADIKTINVALEDNGRLVDKDAKEQLATARQILRYEKEIGDKLNLGVKRLSSVSNSALSEQFVSLIEEQYSRLALAIIEIENHMEVIRSASEDVSADDELRIEYELRGYDDLLSQLLHELLDNTQRAEALNLNSEAQTKRLDESLANRADRQVASMEITGDRMDAVISRLARMPEGEKSELEKQLVVLEERQSRLANGLDSSIDLMRVRGMDVKPYVSALLKSTGEISGNLLNSDVLFGLADDWLQVARDSLVNSGPEWIFKAVVFLVILIITKILSKLASRIVGRAVGSSPMRFSTLLQEFFTKLASNIVLGIGLLIALAQIGIHLGPVLAGLGVAGLIVGFALQDTLSNFASGLMILIYRPYDVGDVIEAAGVSGKVQRMNLVSTTVVTFDNQKLIVPNNKIWGDVIRNVNAAPTRRVDLVFGIGYEDDISRAETLLADIVNTHELVLKDPAPNIRLHQLGESSVDFIVRPWVKADDYWTVYWDLTRAVKQRFTEQGISIPYPQRDVHLYKHDNV